MDKLSYMISLSLLIGVGCHAAVQRPRVAPPTTAPSPHDGRASSTALPGQELATPTASATRCTPELELAAAAMSDEELGRLIETLSEDTDDFPSDNYVSNETSLLHVADTFTSVSRARRAYVGVGPEQNLTHIALMEPAMSYIVDIRRQNMLEHLALRALIEESDTREDFLRTLTARPRPDAATKLAPRSDIEEIVESIRRTEPSPRLADNNVRTTLALMKRLGLTTRDGDEAAITSVLEAFAEKGLDISYSMEGSRRRYPKLGELLVTRDRWGKRRSFVGTEKLYSKLRNLLKANRVVPLVGDFLGNKALAGVAADTKNRSLMLGVFYTSNVEQYLFPRERYRKFVDNISRFSIDRESVFVRVWFDQGTRHPKQLPGHRTTSVTMPISGFLARWQKRPFRSYWGVATARIQQEGGREEAPEH